MLISVSLIYRVKIKNSKILSLKNLLCNRITCFVSPYIWIKITFMRRLWGLIDWRWWNITLDRDDCSIFWSRCHSLTFAWRCVNALVSITGWDSVQLWHPLTKRSICVWFNWWRFRSRGNFDVKSGNFPLGYDSTLATVAARKWSDRSSRTRATRTTDIFTARGRAIDRNLFKKFAA